MHFRSVACCLYGFNQRVNSTTFFIHVFKFLLISSPNFDYCFKYLDTKELSRANTPFQIHTSSIGNTRQPFWNTSSKLGFILIRTKFKIVFSSHPPVTHPQILIFGSNTMIQNNFLSFTPHLISSVQNRPGLFILVRKSKQTFFSTMTLLSGETCTTRVRHLIK